MNVLELYDLNFNVFPLQAGGKKPEGAWRHLQTKRLTRAHLEFIFKKPHNVGIICGELEETGVNILGVDFDAPKAFEAVYSKLPKSPMIARTARGFHVYYQDALGTQSGNRVHLGGLPIDLRGNGGYLVAPPSVRSDGGKYEWEKGPVDAKELPFFPVELLPKDAPKYTTPIVPDRDAIAKARNYLSSAGPAVSGEGGHRKTFRLACKLVHPQPTGFGLTYREALTLMQWWNPMNEPPWSEKELSHKLLDAIKCAK